MNTALLLVDVQHDFLRRPGLNPDERELIPKLAHLQHRCRNLGIPIFHMQTRIRPDGSDRMPHWVRADFWACVTGTPGAEPPKQLEPLPNEPVFTKTSFSGFTNSNLELTLQKLGIKRLLIAGLYLHACIRSTALDAYQRGYEVWIAEDAVGSTEPIHAEATRQWMHGRIAEFIESDAMLSRLALTASKPSDDLTHAVAGACLNHHWHQVETNRHYLHKDPCNSTKTLSIVPCCGREDVNQAIALSHEALAAWSQEPERIRLLLRWHSVVVENTPILLETMVSETGKPLEQANEEIKRALAHIDSCIRLYRAEEIVDDGVLVQYHPVGCIGLLTPWNNPLAIPVGKLAPALAFGNTVVWKPSPRAPRTSKLLMDTLIRAGLPAGAVNVIHGDGDTARLIIENSLIAAISLTGSTATGQAASALCALLNKPLQAELGGNNAAIVLEDADFASCVIELTLAAFSFSGQRCTAIRRFIVSKRRISEFEDRFAVAAKALKIGQPSDPTTQIGPLISQEHLLKVESIVARALTAGARLLCGGLRPAGFQQGNWFSPSVLSNVSPDAELVLSETFGPVAVILPADDLDHAITLANAVPQGLLSRLVTENPNNRARFAKLIKTGIVNYAPGPLTIHPEAPFGGWKSSCIGPPEHGIWDRAFYSRPQAIYR